MSALRTRPPAAPFLAAWYLALVVLGEGRAGAGSLADLGTTLGLATVAAWVGWLLARRLCRDDVAAMLLAVVLVARWSLYGTMRLLLAPRLPEAWAAPAPSLALWLAPALMAILALRRVRGLGAGLQRGLTSALGVLLAVAGFGAARSRPSAGIEATTSVATADARAEDAPDIYLIVLDKFASPATMRAMYGVDLTPFIDSLKALGFVVPARARTNYIHTELVLATLLNGALLHETVPGGTETPWAEARRQIAGGTTWQFLRRRGYRTAFFPTGFPATEDHPGVDLALRSPSTTRSAPGALWLLNSPAAEVRRLACATGWCRDGTVFPYPIQEAGRLRWQLETLQALPDSAGPIFAFLHFLGSHEPYVFQEDCTARAPWWPTTEPDRDSLAARRAYGAQIRCVAALILETVTTLITRSAVPPVILLQADHGHGEIAVDFVRGITRPVEALSSERVAMRLDIFAAYRFPGAATVVPDSITPVNVMPLLFGQLFGESSPYRPDRSFWSTYQDPLNLTEITRAVDTAAGSATTRAVPAGNR